MAYATNEVTEIQERVIVELQTGRSLRQVCKDDGMPDLTTILRWVVLFPEFATKYARARMAQADTLFDRMEVVEEAVTAGSMDSHAARVVLDSMRWRASKLAPKVYGDRLDVSVSDNRISISGALAAAQARLVDVIDVAPHALTHNVHSAQEVHSAYVHSASDAPKPRRLLLDSYIDD
jgi:hypothetical protein